MDERGESTLLLLEHLPWEMAVEGWSRRQKAELISFVKRKVTGLARPDEGPEVTRRRRRMVTDTLEELCKVFGLPLLVLPVRQLKERAATLVDQDGFFEEVQRGLSQHHYVDRDEDAEEQDRETEERSVDSWLEVTTATGENLWVPGIARDILRLAVLCRETKQVSLLRSFLTLGYLKGLVDASETSEETDSDSSEIQDEDLVACILNDQYHREMMNLEGLVRSRKVTADCLFGKRR